MSKTVLFILFERCEKCAPRKYRSGIVSMFPNKVSSPFIAAHMSVKHIFPTVFRIVTPIFIEAMAGFTVKKIRHTFGMRWMIPNFTCRRLALETQLVL
jgi:hypothetical protein